jgi:hypothetical protein
VAAVVEEKPPDTLELWGIVFPSTEKTRAVKANLDRLEAEGPVYHSDAIGRNYSFDPLDEEWFVSDEYKPGVDELNDRIYAYLHPVDITVPPKESEVDSLIGKAYDRYIERLNRSKGEGSSKKIPISAPETPPRTPTQTEFGEIDRPSSQDLLLLKATKNCHSKSACVFFGSFFGSYLHGSITANPYKNSTYGKEPMFTLKIVDEARLERLCPNVFKILESKDGNKYVIRK